MGSSWYLWLGRLVYSTLCEYKIEPKPVEGSRALLSARTSTSTSQAIVRLDLSLFTSSMRLFFSKLACDGNEEGLLSWTCVANA